MLPKIPPTGLHRLGRLLSTTSPTSPFPLANDRLAELEAPELLVRLAKHMPFLRRDVVALPLTLISAKAAEKLAAKPLKVALDPFLLCDIHNAAIDSYETDKLFASSNPSTLERLELLLSLLAADMAEEVAEFPSMYREKGVELYIYRTLLMPMNAIMRAATKSTDAMLWHEPSGETKRSVGDFELNWNTERVLAAELKTPISFPPAEISALMKGVADGWLYTGEDGTTRCRGMEGKDRGAQGKPCRLLDQLKSEFLSTGGRPHFGYIVVTNGHDFFVAYRATPDADTIFLSPVVRAGDQPLAHMLPASPGGLILSLSLATRWIPPDLSRVRQRLEQRKLNVR